MKGRIFGWNHTTCVATLMLGICSPSLAQDEEKTTSNTDGRISGSVTLASDYVFRGVSQTMGRPSLQLYADADVGHGFYAYVWGSNVDFFPDYADDDGARMEIDLAFGYSAAIGDLWSVDLSVVRFLFPGTTDGVDYDYNELITTWRYNEGLGATIGFAKNVDGTEANSWFYELDNTFDLPTDMTLELGLGYYDLEDAYGAGYSYARASLSRYFDDNALALALFSTFGDVDEVFYRQASGTRVVLSLEIPF